MKSYVCTVKQRPKGHVHSLHLLFSPLRAQVQLWFSPSVHLILFHDPEENSRGSRSSTQQEDGSQLVWKVASHYLNNAHERELHLTLLWKSQRLPTKASFFTDHKQPLSHMNLVVQSSNLFSSSFFHFTLLDSKPQTSSKKKSLRFMHLPWGGGHATKAPK